MKYKFVEDLTSDVMYEAYGKDLKELFENAAKGMFHIISCGNAPLKGERAQKKLELKNSGV